MELGDKQSSSMVISYNYLLSFHFLSGVIYWLITFLSDLPLIHDPIISKLLLLSGAMCQRRTVDAILPSNVCGPGVLGAKNYVELALPFLGELHDSSSGRLRSTTEQLVCGHSILSRILPET
jgi:hypothetical protein